MSTESPAAHGVAERGKPETFRARAVSISLSVKDLQASLAWYRDVFGFIVGERHERDGVLRAVEMKAGAVRILIGQDDGAKGWDRVKGQGVSFQFTTAQSVDEIAQRIKAHGVVLDSEPADMPWGVRAFRVRDPDGFGLVVSSERVARAAPTSDPTNAKA
jgi:catechol 2,3-dioxygenase-like lactoylglutathione lyase family enzyme